MEKEAIAPLMNMMARTMLEFDVLMIVPLTTRRALSGKRSSHICENAVVAQFKAVK